MYLPTKGWRAFVYHSDVSEALNDDIELLSTEIGIHRFASLKAHNKFNFVTFGKELSCMLELDLKISRVRTITKPQLFDRVLRTILLCLSLFFLFCVFELTVIKDLTNRRFRLWSNFYEIEF